MSGFRDIIGQEQIKEHFTRAIENHTVSHAYILSGEAGMGKMMMAKAFAMTLLCERGGLEPCMECHSCRQFASDNHPDVIYVRHEKPNSIGVDDIRVQLNNDIAIKPYSSAYKIYIVDEAEKMTIQAQNAMLKTIEEPPSYGVILLLTTNTEAFLPTILSRCIAMKFKPLSDKAIQSYLMDKLGIPRDQADICTAFARGNLGKAAQLASSEEFNLMRSKVLSIMKHVKEMDISELLAAIKELVDLKLDINECLDFMQMWYRDVLMFKVTNNINLLIFKDEYKAINDAAKVGSFEGLEGVVHAVDKAKIRLGANVNMELAMELMLLTMKEN